MMFTVIVFAGSVLLLLIAAICYVPLLCYIQGNLKVSADSTKIIDVYVLIELVLGILLSQGRQGSYSY